MAEPAKAEAINIVVKDQTGGEVHFKIKKSTRFEKVGFGLARRAGGRARPRARCRRLTCFHPLQVFDAYCAKKSIEPNTVKFLFDGSRVQKEDTPESVGPLARQHPASRRPAPTQGQPDHHADDLVAPAPGARSWRRRLAAGPRAAARPRSTTWRTATRWTASSSRSADARL